MPNIFARKKLGPVVLQVATEAVKASVAPGVYYPYPADAPVLVDANRKVVLGSAQAWAAREQTPVVVVKPDHHQRLHLRQLDDSPQPLASVRAHAAATLRALRLPLRMIRGILGCSDLGTASRWIQCGALPSPVLQALDHGTIQFGHARYLLRQTPEQALRWLVAIREGRWTVQKLRNAMAGRCPEVPVATADIATYANQLSEALGATVRIVWPDTLDGRCLAVAWYDVETLRGILGHLAAGTGTSATGSALRRELVIQIRDSDELDALVGHLGMDPQPVR